MADAASPPGVELRLALCAASSDEALLGALSVSGAVRVRSVARAARA